MSGKYSVRNYEAIEAVAMPAWKRIRPQRGHRFNCRSVITASYLTILMFYLDF